MWWAHQGSNLGPYISHLLQVAKLSCSPEGGTSQPFTPYDLSVQLSVSNPFLIAGILVFQSFKSQVDQQTP